MKKFLSLMLIAVLLFTAAACSEGEKNPSSGDTPRTVTDHLGNVIELPEKLDRVVVCDPYPLPSVLAVFFGSADKIVGMPPASMNAAKNGLLGQLYPALLSAETGFSSGSGVNVEELLKLSPDIVFYSASNPSVGEQLRSLGVAAVAVSANKWEYDAFETMNQWISLLSEIFGDADKAAAVRAYGEQTLSLVRERVADVTDKKDVFFLFQYNETTLMTSGKRFFGQWWADAIGTENVGKDLDAENGVQVSMEQVYAWDPDIIFITNFNTAKPEDLLNNTVGNYDWSPVSAVKNGEVYKMPLGFYRSYTTGADAPITLLWLAKTAYPDLFADIDVTSEARTYFKDVFGIELTDGQIESIFAPSSEAGKI